MRRHLTFVAIYSLIGIPWYWSLVPYEWAMMRVYGLPLWVAVSIAGSFGVSVHACLVFCRPWPMESEGLEGSASGEGSAKQ